MSSLKIVSYVESLHRVGVDNLSKSAKAELEGHFKITLEDNWAICMPEGNNLSLAVVCISEDKVIGGLFAVISPSTFNLDKLISSEIHFYVLPDYRGRAGALLYLSWERWSRDRGASYMRMSSDFLLKEEALARLGFIEKEISYLREISHGK